MKAFEIFRPGKHIATNGATFTFTEADLKATAAAYDPAKHEAPIVVGHPKNDGPAYGWAKSLSFGDTLQAEPDQVDPAFAEMVGAGRFKKISAAFYAPDAPQNPVPGVYYLRHIGFLGAQPPAVKGLKNASFSDADKGVIEFGDWNDVQHAAMWRRMREWIIGKFGTDEADKVVPGYVVDSLQADAAQTENLGAQVAYAEQQRRARELAAQQENHVDKTQADALTADNVALKAKVAEFTEREKGIKDAEAKQRRVDIVAFVEGLKKAGKILPVHEAGLVSLLAQLPADTVVEFGEGDKKESHPSLKWAQKFLGDLPKVVEFREVGKDGQVAEDQVADPAALAKAAVEFQESESKAGRNVNSAEAVAHVQAKLAKK